MQFLYPKSRQFPFDAACEQIVRALQARNWKVPGFTVEFRDYGSGSQKLRYVDSIKSDQSPHEVTIKFGRYQAHLPGGRWDDSAAVKEIHIAKQILRVYPDESGPSYYIYVGTDWEHDRATWWSRPNTRLQGEPRMCINYSGRSHWLNVRASTLTWDEDSREYGPEGEDPRSFETARVMEEFHDYLRNIILPAIEEYPVAATAEEVAVEPPIPMPAGTGYLFTYGEGSDEFRITTGKKNLNALKPPDQYGLHGGRRLAPTYIKPGPDLPAVAYDGFLWCGPTPTVPGEITRGDVLIKITPKDASGIYVADHAVYHKVRTALWEKIAGTRDSLTNAEVNLFIRARACTIVSIIDYKGDYEDPLYLINRELALDEVEVIGRRPSHPT